MNKGEESKIKDKKDKQDIRNHVVSTTTGLFIQQQIMFPLHNNALTLKKPF